MFFCLHRTTQRSRVRVATIKEAEGKESLTESMLLLAIVTEGFNQATDACCGLPDCSKYELYSHCSTTVKMSLDTPVQTLED